MKNSYTHLLILPNIVDQARIRKKKGTNNLMGSKSISSGIALKSPMAFADIAKMEVDDDFDSDDDHEACNAPSTRKSNSETRFDNNSPFIGDSIVSFSEKAFGFMKEKEEVKLDLEIPTKSSQLEKDMRSLKTDLESQREYLLKIKPSSLPSIFSDSIE